MKKILFIGSQFHMKMSIAGIDHCIFIISNYYYDSQVFTNWSIRRCIVIDLYMLVVIDSHCMMYRLHIVWRGHTLHLMRKGLLTAGHMKEFM